MAERIVTLKTIQQTWWKDAYLQCGSCNAAPDVVAAAKVLHALSRDCHMFAGSSPTVYDGVPKLVLSPLFLHYYLRFNRKSFIEVVPGYCTGSIDCFSCPAVRSWRFMDEMAIPSWGPGSRRVTAIDGEFQSKLRAGRLLREGSQVVRKNE